MTWVRLRLPGLRAPSSSSACCRSPSRPSCWWSASRRSTPGSTTSSASPRVWLCFAYVVLVLPYAYRVAGRRAARHRRAHPVGGGPLARRELVHRDVAGRSLPNLRSAVLLGVVPLGGPGARRVHHRQPVQHEEPPGGDVPARQARREDLGRRGLLAALLFAFARAVRDVVRRQQRRRRLAARRRAPHVHRADRKDAAA